MPLTTEKVITLTSLNSFTKPEFIFLANHVARNDIHGWASLECGDAILHFTEHMIDHPDEYIVRVPNLEDRAFVLYNKNSNKIIDNVKSVSFINFILK